MFVIQRLPQTIVATKDSKLLKHNIVDARISTEKG